MKTRNAILYLIFIVLFSFIYNQIFFSYKVTGSSMYPNLKSGQMGLALKTHKGISDIKRFDIVIIKNNDRYIVKRVIGLPDEQIEYKDNKLYINGNYIEEKYLSDTNTDNFIFKTTGGYFCLGDNRGNSLDSRKYGEFMQSEIVAILIRR